MENYKELPGCVAARMRCVQLDPSALMFYMIKDVSMLFQLFLLGGRRAFFTGFRPPVGASPAPMLIPPPIGIPPPAPPNIAGALSGGGAPLPKPPPPPNAGAGEIPAEGALKPPPKGFAAAPPSPEVIALKPPAPPNVGAGETPPEALNPPLKGLGADGAASPPPPNGVLVAPPNVGATDDPPKPEEVVPNGFAPASIPGAEAGLVLAPKVNAPPVGAS